MAIGRLLCPKCKTPSDESHCDPKDFPGANCPWWKCLVCKITFNAKGRISTPPAEPKK